RPRGKHVVGPVPSSGAAHAALLPAHPVAGEERPPERLAALQEVAHERALLLEPFLHALADRFRAEHQWMVLQFFYEKHCKTNGRPARCQSFSSTEGGRAYDGGVTARAGHGRTGGERCGS